MRTDSVRPERRSRRWMMVALASVVAGSSSAWGATYTGSGGDVNWNNAGNWDPGIPAEGEAIFIADTTGQTSVNLNDGSHAVGLVTFGDTGTRTAAFSINGGAGNGLTFNAGFTNTQTTTTGIFLNVNVPVTIQGEQTFTVGGGAGSVVSDAGVNFSATSSSFTLNGKLIKEGPGQLLFIGRTIGNGDIDVNAGSLKLNAGSSVLLTAGGTGTITVKSGATLMVAKNSGTLSLTKAIAIQSGGTLSVGGNNVPATIPTVGSNISWAGTTTFNLNSNTANQVLDFTGNWSGSGTITTTSSGTGTGRYMILSGNNSGLSAQFTNNVTLAVGSDNALGTGIYRANTTTSVLRAADANPRIVPNVIDVAANTTFGSAGSGDLTFTATGTLGSHTGISTGGAAKTLTILNNRTTISGIVTSSSGTNALTKAGPGILEFSGANTYDRPTAIIAGTLQVTGLGRIGSPANTRTVTVGDAGLLDLQVAGLADGATLDITSTDATPEVNVGATVNDVVSMLVINGVTMSPGTYGSSASLATNPGLADPDEIFSGSGVLTVAVPEPGSLAILGVAAVGLLRRRRKMR